MINKLNRKISAGWAYLAIFVAVSVVCLPVSIESIRQMVDHSYELAQYPSLGLDEAEREFKTLRDVIENQPVGQPSEYFAMLTRLEMLEGACRKGEQIYQEHALRSDVYRFREIELYITSLIRDLQYKYTNVHGLTVMGKAAEEYRVQHGEPTYLRGRYHLVPLGRPWLQTYLWTLPLFGLFFLIRLKQNEFKLLLEFVNWLKPVWATALWPIAIFRYPNGDASQQLVHALRFMSWILTASMSVFAGGVAKAAEKQSDQKKQQGFSLQLDGHHYERMDDPDRNPDDLVRVNLATPPGFYTEYLRLRNASSATSFLTVGTPVAHPPGGVVNAYVGIKTVDEEPEGSRSVLAGIQAFITKKRFSFALPVAHVERSTASKPTTTLATVSVATLGFGKRCYAGLESLIKRSDDGSGFWYSGPVLGCNINPSFVAEVGCFKNSDEEVRCRLRAMQTVRW